MRGKATECLKSQSCFPFYPGLLRILGYEEAITLSHMISLDRHASQEAKNDEREYDGWFLYSKDAFGVLSIHCKAKQTRIIQNLNGIVKNSKRGLPGLRWVCIDYGSLNSAIIGHINEKKT